MGDFGSDDEEVRTWSVLSRHGRCTESIFTTSSSGDVNLVQLLEASSRASRILYYQYLPHRELRYFVRYR